MGGLRGMFGGKRSSLDEVASKGDVSKLRKLVEKGANVNGTSPDPKLFHRAPIHAATAKGHVSTVEALINLGADVDMRDMMGRTPLHVAALCSQNSIISILLNCGADYTMRDTSGRMPIHLALSCGNLGAKEVLLGRALEHSLEFEFFEQGHWLPFDEAASRLLGFELGDGVGFAALSLGPEANYIVDFEEQIQVNVLSLFMKSVSWRVLPSGRWNRPRFPHQGLHPGSQDPRRLLKYETLLRSLGAQGVRLCPLYLQLHQAATGGAALARPSLPSAPMRSATDQDGAQAQRHLQQAVQQGYPQEPLGVAWTETGEESDPGTPLQRPRADSGSLPGEASFDSIPRLCASAQEYEQIVGGPVETAVALQPLRSGSEEYNEVAARFLRGMAKPARGAPGQAGGGGGDLRPVTVGSIQRVRFPWGRVEPFFKARASFAARWGAENVRRGWHGGPRPALDRILRQGFVLPPHGRNGRMYGDGVYLASEDCARTSAEFAGPDESGTKHVLLCAVALGSCEQIPFDSSQRRPSNVMRYDTGVDNLESPTRYIIWEEDMNDLILPTYLLAFRYC